MQNPIRQLLPLEGNYNQNLINFAFANARGANCKAGLRLYPIPDLDNANVGMQY